MKKIKLSLQFAFLLSVLLSSGCSMFGLDLQKDAKYEHQTLDPNIYISARQFLENRSYASATNLSDTVFKWMRKGIDYAEIDLAAYEKQGMTFIFLHNEAVRVWDAKAKKVTGGLWFDFPIVTGTDPVTKLPVTRPAVKWEDYPKEDVKNYFLYLMLQGTYNFGNLTISNVTAQTLLPPSTAASKVSLLGYLNDGKGFDQEGKVNLKLLNNSDLAPIQLNDRTVNRSGGYIATNAVVHVYGNTVYPYR